MDDRAEIFEFLSEVDKACDRPIDIEDIEREVSATEYSTRGEGKYIASVLDKTLPFPTCMSRPNLRR